LTKNGRKHWPSENVKGDVWVDVKVSNISFWRVAGRGRIL